MTNKTIIITFGHKHGEPPPADMTVDLRDVQDHDYDVMENEAKSIAKEIEPGSVVALGCENGCNRSVHIARLIQKHMPNIAIVDRDLSSEAAKD